MADLEADLAIASLLSADLALDESLGVGRPIGEVIGEVAVDASAHEARSLQQDWSQNPQPAGQYLQQNESLAAAEHGEPSGAHFGFEGLMRDTLLLEQILADSEQLSVDPAPLTHPTADGRHVDDTLREGAGFHIPTILQGVPFGNALQEVRSANHRCQATIVAEIARIEAAEATIRAQLNDIDGNPELQSATGWKRTSKRGSAGGRVDQQLVQGRRPGQPFFTNSQGEVPPANADTARMRTAKLKAQRIYHHRRWTRQERRQLAEGVRMQNRKLLMVPLLGDPKYVAASQMPTTQLTKEQWRDIRELNKEIDAIRWAYNFNDRCVCYVA